MQTVLLVLFIACSLLPLITSLPVKRDVPANIMGTAPVEKLEPRTDSTSNIAIE